MKRSELEKYINKKVKIILFDKTEILGTLHKTGEEKFKDNPNLYIPRNYYFCTEPQSCLFRSSHIIKLEEIK